jgi:cobalt transporter subunit CbtB
MTRTVDSNIVVPAPADHSTGARASWWPSLAALALSITILAMVGFAPGIAHNAAHDVRHTVAFPCH